MTITSFMDKTSAVRRKDAAATINDDGEFVDPTETLETIFIHVGRPKLDEALPGGLHVQSGDVIVHADATRALEAGELLEFHGGLWRLVTAIRQYDVLEAVLNHGRRSYLARRHGEQDGEP